MHPISLSYKARRGSSPDYDLSTTKIFLGPLGGSGGMLPWKILKFRLSRTVKIAFRDTILNNNFENICFFCKKQLKKKQFLKLMVLQKKLFEYFKE